MDEIDTLKAELALTTLTLQTLMMALARTGSLDRDSWLAMLAQLELPPNPAEAPWSVGYGVPPRAGVTPEAWDDARQRYASAMRAMGRRARWND